MPNEFWPAVRMEESEFDTYVAIVASVATRFKGRLDVRLGIESEFFPGFERYLRALHRRADFHFILGSVHFQSKEYLTRFGRRGVDALRRTYFSHLAEAAETGLYDCLSHPDLVKNYKPASWSFAALKTHVARCLDRIAATGVAMELNTSGLNKGYAEMNPGNDMLAMMAERAIPVVVGSDAHRPQRVGDRFVEALENLHSVGYREVSYFVKRERKTLAIGDVLDSLRDGRRNA